jgi:hypothetical protein
MKTKTLVLSLFGLLGCAVGAQASIDVTVNGVEYAITTVTPTLTYDSANGDSYFSYPNTLTQTLFSSLAGQAWFGATGADAAVNFSDAYIAAVEAADPNAGTDGSLQAADNTVFINSAYGATSATSTTMLGGYDDGTAGNHILIYQTTPLNQPWTLAEATVVVPEPAAYGWAGASLLLLGLGASALRKARLASF